MTAENDDTTVAPVEKKTGARRGPRKAEDIRAEVEAEMRERIEAEMREKIEAEVRAQMEDKDAELERAKAQAAEARPINAAAVDGDPTVDGSLTVHFVEDGLTILGRVWYRGEELTINPGTENWELAHAVLSLDEFGQETKWGRRFFREGPWRGKRLDEIDDEELTDEERKALKKAAAARDERYGALAR